MAWKIQVIRFTNKTTRLVKKEITVKTQSHRDQEEETEDKTSQVING